MPPAGTRPIGAVLLVASLLVPPPTAAQGAPTFKSQGALVLLAATAVDKHGRPVLDLKPEEIRVFEEGRPQKIEHFSTGREAAARVLLLVDASGSMNAQLKTTSSKMAVTQVLGALETHDQVALAGFDDHYFGVVPFTADRPKILAGFSELRPWGATALHDALDHAAHDLASHGEGRKAVVVITDGVDNASHITPEEVLERSRALDVPIYALSVVAGIDDPASDRFAGAERPALSVTGAAVLERYARLSGGAAYTVSEFPQLQAAAARIVQEIKHQYRLGYDPPDGPPGFRRVEVRTTRKGVVLRTRRGYVPAS